MFASESVPTCLGLYELAHGCKWREQDGTFRPVSLLTPVLAPHIYLGVASQSTKTDCGAGFARAIRRLKSTSSTPFTVQDLTSALSTAEQVGDGEFSLTYSLPANPRVSGGADTITISGRQFDFQSELETLSTEGLDLVEKERIATFLLRYAMERLWSWDWLCAGAAAQQCLRFSREEDTRDEALNVLAASLAMRGETRKAIDALKQAVIGRWNLNLQGNLVLLASTDSPELAVEHLTHFVLGAQSTRDRLGASRMAVNLWSRVSEGLGGGDAPPMPRSVIDSFHDLLKQPGLTEEEFFDLGLFLTETEDNENAVKRVVKSSAYGSTVSARLLLAHLDSFDDYAVALVKAENAGELSGRQWLTDKLNGMIATMNQMFSSNETDNKPVNFAYGLIDNGLRCKTLERITLLSFMVWHLKEVFTNENEVPKDEFVTWVVDAHSQSRFSDAFPDRNQDHIELVQGFIQSAINALTFLYYRGYWNMAIKVQDDVNALIAENQRWFPDRNAMRKSAQDVVTWADWARANLRPLRLRCEDTELNPHVDKLLEFITQFRNTVSSFT